MTKATKRGRAPGFTMSAEHRGKIQNSNILNALIQHTEGKREMSASQVSAGLGLLKKALPDLQSVESTIHGDQTVRILADKPLTEDEWEKRYCAAEAVLPTKAEH